MMRKHHRVGFTAAQSAELWDRWRKGESLSAIGREFGKPSSSIFGTIQNFVLWAGFIQTL